MDDIEIKQLRERAVKSLENKGNKYPTINEIMKEMNSLKSTDNIDMPDFFKDLFKFNK